ncbi:hypothetical protein K432DRAFT_381216 [Lepidopterella palustris CBS 459.81]|uniref:NAD dependent epimerase/dehydratase n=1 Tax=Lepidopterella palustris CBS 459.81 TaxID=1314670 RepID=A0A8E2ECP0_9PEZI|nr:hypothetical protein K432DRAFT_381216 [Lepidopterella palustris CBS 459.81]
MAPELKLGHVVDWTGTTWKSRRGMKRIVPMEVLVLGLGRTGTMSMVEALRILGYNDVYHMSAAIANPPDFDMWKEAADAKFFGNGKPYGREEWDQLLGNCMAVTDFPTCAFSAELIAAYPHAKVVLTTRDPSKWYASVNSTFRVAFESRAFSLIGHLDPAFIGRMMSAVRSLWLGFFGVPDVQPCIVDTFVKHNEAVKAMTPPERFLEYRVGEGWERLCEFLGKEVPECEFPRINEANNFTLLLQKMMVGSIVRCAKTIGLYMAPVVVVGVAVYVGMSN